MNKLKVAFLAYYPAMLLREHLDLVHDEVEHPASWVVNLTKALAKRSDIELHVISESVNVRGNQDVEVDNVRYHFIKSPSTLNLSTLYYFNVRRLIGRVREVHPDIVHTHGCEGSVGLAGVYSRRPCLVSMQGLLTEYAAADKYWLGKSPLRSWLMGRIERHVLRKAKYVGTRTQFAEDFVRRKNPKARILFVPEAMNDIFFDVSPTLDAKHIVCVGGITPRKDVVTLIRALAIVCRTHPDCKLSIVGTGPKSHVAEIEKETSALGLGSIVRLLGFRSTESIARLLEECSVFVLPSLSENSPNSLAEAMCAGLPVVATNVGGIPSMVENDVTGILVDPRNVDALASAINRLLGNHELRKRLGGAARAKALQVHRSEKVAEQAVVVYKQILELESSASAASRQ